MGANRVMPPYGSNFTCNICSKSFTHSKTLKIHVCDVHEGHKDYKCDCCGKSCTTLKLLETHHHTVHDGYKDHKCDSCGKSYVK